eukprot:m.452752 g.452752  ORF g.452752 m.452752 type:complete len:56 (+) comp20391_c0_seq1:245-412(+)
MSDDLFGQVQTKIPNHISNMVKFTVISRRIRVCAYAWGSVQHCKMKYCESPTMTT